MPRFVIAMLLPFLIVPWVEAHSIEYQVENRGIMCAIFLPT